MKKPEYVEVESTYTKDGSYFVKAKGQIIQYSDNGWMSCDGNYIGVDFSDYIKYENCLLLKRMLTKLL